MKTINFSFSIITITILFISQYSFGQRAYIRSKIRNDIEKKQVEKHQADKEKGVKAIEDITYENDTRYKDFKGKTQATLEFKNTDFDKKGNAKESRTEKIVFGKLGECMAMNIGQKDEIWMMANYIDKATYMVNVKDKTAMKMPMMNFRKMADKMAKNQVNSAGENDKEKGTWQATNETKKINGFKCKKYIYTYPENSKLSTLETWVTKDLTMVMDNNYMFGTNIGNMKTTAIKDYNVPIGMMILTKAFNKKNILVNERELVKATKQTEEKYFDLTPFKINDVLDALR